MNEKENAIENVQKNNTLAEFFQANKKSISEALPKHMSAERMIKILFTSIRKTPELGQCTKESLLSALIECSQLGLEPDGIRGQAYLIPFNNNKTGKKDVQFIPGYKGLVELARRSGEVKDIYYVAVYENEPFKLIQGLKRDLQHEPLPPKQRGEKLKGCYCVTPMTTGETSFSWMWAEEIEAIRQRSKAKNFGPWTTDFEAMALKTVIRKHMKLMPLSPEIQSVLAKDELFDAGLTEDEINITPTENKPAVNVPKPNDEEKLLKEMSGLFLEMKTPKEEQEKILKLAVKNIDAAYDQTMDLYNLFLDNMSTEENKNEQSLL